MTFNKQQLPNLLTLLRIVLIPVFVVVFFLPFESARIVATVILFIAGVTDWLDGFLARRYDLHSPLGAFLDPVADKLMVSTALVAIAVADPQLVIGISVMVIIGREITISALREWMAEVGARATVAVSMIGKFKTAAQMLALGFLVYRDDLWGIPVYTVGVTLLLISVVLTLWSMVVYLKAAWPSLAADEFDEEP